MADIKKHSRHKGVIADENFHQYGCFLCIEQFACFLFINQHQDCTKKLMEFLDLYDGPCPLKMFFGACQCAWRRSGGGREERKQARGRVIEARRPHILLFFHRSQQGSNSPLGDSCVDVHVLLS